MDRISAVSTTGIYCRPGCGAQPLAASAEAAGYRACMRCRPYRWPQSVSWTAPELVCRAVRLVLDGILDNASEADLGVRLGVSARHLRRLFLEHVGVPPVVFPSEQVDVSRAGLRVAAESDPGREDDPHVADVDPRLDVRHAGREPHLAEIQLDRADPELVLVP